MLKIGIIGCGTIGKAIAEYCADKLKNRVLLRALFDMDKAKAEALKTTISSKAAIVDSMDSLIKVSDLVVEAASVEAATELLDKAIKARQDVMIMSVGALAGTQDFISLAREAGCKVYIPSGAILGLDGIKAAALAGIDTITLTTTKPVKGLKGAPYIQEKKIDLDTLKGDTVIFDGSARDAIKAFPKNINVSCILGLAGVGMDKTKVKIICSPKANSNTHEIKVSSKAGEFFIQARNVPSPENPKTSYLALLSAIATIKNIVDSINIGT